MAKEFTFNFQKYKNPAITVDQLDEEFKKFFSDLKPSYLSLILAAIKLVLIFAYIYTRKILVDQQQQIEKQQYQQAQSQSNRDEIDNESLDNR